MLFVWWLFPWIRAKPAFIAIVFIQLQLFFYLVSLDLVVSYPATMNQPALTTVEKFEPD